jgi:hypothetical protein
MGKAQDRQIQQWAIWSVGAISGEEWGDDGKSREIKRRDKNCYVRDRVWEMK